MMLMIYLSEKKSSVLNSKVHKSVRGTYLVTVSFKMPSYFPVTLQQLPGPWYSSLSMSENNEALCKFVNCVEDKKHHHVLSDKCENQSALL